MSDDRKGFFVRTDGSDKNDGRQNLSSRAFRTVQKAVDAAYDMQVRSASPLTIHVASGLYTEDIKVRGVIPAIPDNKGFSLRIIGDEAHPGRVQIEATGSDAVYASHLASILVAGVTLRTRESGRLLVATQRATLGHRNCVLGEAASESISAHRYAEIYATGPTLVAGGSTAFAHATTRSTISFTGKTIQFEEGVAFSRYLWGVNDATIRLDKGRIIGRGRGNIAVHINGVLNVSGLHGEWRGGSEPRVLDGGLIATGNSPA